MRGPAPRIHDLRLGGRAGAGAVACQQCIGIAQGGGKFCVVCSASNAEFGESVRPNRKVIVFASVSAFMNCVISLVPPLYLLYYRFRIVYLFEIQNILFATELVESVTLRIALPNFSARIPYRFTIPFIRSMYSSKP